MEFNKIPETEISLKTKKCSYCLHKCSMKMNCKFCYKSHCLRCIQPEIHECEKLEIMKESLKNKLSLKLTNERCVKPKINAL
jgi:hypothetical protein